MKIFIYTTTESTTLKTTTTESTTLETTTAKSSTKEPITPFMTYSCDFDKNDYCGGILSSNVSGSLGLFRTDEAITVDAYTITDITSICKYFLFKLINDMFYFNIYLITIDF